MLTKRTCVPPNVQEETIIFALIERAQFAVNKTMYATDAQSLSVMQVFRPNNPKDKKSFLDFMLLV